MARLELGSIVGGKYRVVRPLRAGGLDAVYEAEHCLSFQPSLIKQLTPSGGEAQLQELLAAARKVATVQHPNVIALYDVVRQDASVLLIMEVLLGEPLSVLLGRDAPTMHELVRLLLPAMAGASAAHARAVVHGRLTPARVFLAQVPDYSAPRPTLIDFALPPPENDPTALAYRAPEQLHGEPIDARADVYAFGVMLYESLVGAPPYGTGPDARAQATSITHQRPIPPRALRREIPAALDALVMRAIAKARDDRFPSMTALSDALAPFAAVDAYTAPVRVRTPRPRELPRLAHLDLGGPRTGSFLRPSWPAQHRRTGLIAALALTASLVTLAIAARTRDVIPAPFALPASPEPRAPIEDQTLRVLPAEALPPVAPEVAARAGESDGGPTRPAQDPDDGRALPAARPSAAARR